MMELFNCWIRQVIRDETGITFSLSLSFEFQRMLEIPLISNTQLSLSFEFQRKKERKRDGKGKREGNKETHE